MLDALQPVRAGDLPLPRRERVRAGVVTARDDVLWAFLGQTRSMTAAIAWP